MKGYLYILRCSDGSYYTGSTTNLERRLAQHQSGEGANHTKKHLPVELVYYEEYARIDEAFYREKQIQGWSRKKQEALINWAFEKLKPLSMAYRDLRKESSLENAKGVFENKKGGFENLSHPEVSLPEILEAEAQSVVSRTSTTDSKLPEILEGSDKKAP